MSNKVINLIVAVFIAGIFSACSGGKSGDVLKDNDQSDQLSSASYVEGAECVSSDQCADGLTCLSGICSMGEAVRQVPLTVPKINELVCPAVESSNVSGAIEFGADVVNAQFVCKLDGSALTDCIPPFVFSNLQLGKHLFSVYAKNSDHSQSATQTCSWNIVSNLEKGEDVVPEEISISGFAVSALGGMKIKLSWDAPTFASSEVVFKIYRDGNELASLSNKYDYLDMAPKNGSYSYNVKMFSGGKESSSNTQVVAPIPVAGDVNGDGFPDFIVGAAGANGGMGAAYIFYGAQDPLSFVSNPAFKIVNAAGRYYSVYPNLAEKVRLLGDINGDGFEDAGVLGTSGNRTDGKIFIFFGALSRQAELNIADADVVTPNVYRVASFAPVGDVDKDGFDDFAIGTIGGQYAAVVRGRADWSSYADSDKLTMNVYSGPYVAGSKISVEGIGDYDNDGKSDIALTRCSRSEGELSVSTFVEVYSASSSSQAIMSKNIAPKVCLDGVLSSPDNGVLNVGFPSTDMYQGSFWVCLNSTCTELVAEQQHIPVSSICGRIKHSNDDAFFYAHGSSSEHMQDGSFEVYSPIQLPDSSWKNFIEVTHQGSSEELGASCGASKNVLDAASSVSTLMVGAPGAGNGAGKVYILNPIDASQLVELNGGASERFGTSIGVSSPL